MPRRSSSTLFPYTTLFRSAAERLGVPVLQPERLDAGDVCIHSHHSDAIIVAAYGLLIPESLLERGLWLNVHPSLLPRWRGRSEERRVGTAGGARLPRRRRC